MTGKFLIAQLALLLTLVACSEDATLDLPEPASAAPRVYTVNYPLAWMAQALAGSALDVHFPAPGDVDPAFWEPDVDTILEYQQADLVLLNGANYARWVARVSLPGDSLRDTSVNYRDRLVPMESGPVHSHGPAGEHSHGKLAFTTWLDLELAQLQMQAVAVALAEILPDALAVGLATRESELTQLLAGFDRELAAIGADLGGAPLLYSHPVYQYLDRRYKLNGKSLHWEPGEMPDEGQWRELESMLVEHPARLMLWEGQPLPEVTARLESLGVGVVVFLPMGNRPESGDFASVMSQNVQRLRAALDELDQGKG
jgi:zinc transport system substrate-binding protein